MSNTTVFLGGFIAWLVIVLVIARAFGINGRNPAAPTAGPKQDSDARLDELRDYTTNHVRAGTAWGREL